MQATVTLKDDAPVHMGIRCCSRMPLEASPSPSPKFFANTQHTLPHEEFLEISLSPSSCFPVMFRGPPGPTALGSRRTDGLDRRSLRGIFLACSLQAGRSLGTLSLCCRPIILDPADPTHNVAEGYRWDIVAQRASQCLKQCCCYDNKDIPVPSWAVKVMAPPRTVGDLNLRMR